MSRNISNNYGGKRSDTDTGPRLPRATGADGYFACGKG